MSDEPALLRCLIPQVVSKLFPTVQSEEAHTRTTSVVARAASASDYGAVSNEVPVRAGIAIAAAMRGAREKPKSHNGLTP